ncbi:MFS transporter [Priestia aryabhattai]|uniref:MFS transporter n=1 Tax=Priestia aryabhattai TaxID=412384 RepID=UPI001FB24C94|nr:MFS transporter [Priestia aryabhattai]
MKRRIILTGVLVATILAAMESTIVSTAAPSIAKDLSNLDMISWIFSIYLLASAVSAPIFGKLADIFGIKKIFIIGMILFLIGSLACGFATSMNQLIIARAVQGLGGGSVFPLCRTILGLIYIDEKERSKAQGWESAIYGIAGVLGPLAGGIIVDNLSWHYVFLITVPIGLIASILIIVNFKEQIPGVKHKVDYIGATIFSIGTISLIFALLEGSKLGWPSLKIMILFIIAAISLFVFIYVERKAQEPLIPLNLFKDPGLLMINVITLFSGAILIGITTYIPTWSQTILGNSASQSGLLLTPLLVLWTSGSFIVGIIAGKLTSNKIIRIGSIILLVATFLLSTVSHNTSEMLIYIYTGLLGLGMGLIVPLIIVYIQSNISNNELGSAMGLNAFINTLSQAIGVSIFGAIFSYSTVGASNQVKAIESGTHYIFIGTVILALLIFGATFLLKKKDVERQY